MLINWLPLLLVEQGFQPSQAAGVMFALQMGAASGTLMLGALMDKLRPVTMSLLIYSGMLASLLALGTVSSFNGMLLAGFVAGLFATGGQSVLYALAPLFYSSQIRATGVGTAVAVGRLGAMSGPLLAGKMLALGTGAVGVMAASAPGILVAGLAVFILMSRRSECSRVPMPDALLSRGERDLPPIHPRRLQVYSLKIIQRVWKQRWQNLPYKSSCSKQD